MDPHLEAIAKVVLICIAFGVVHSIPAITHVKDRAARLFGEEAVRGLYRLSYTFFSLTTVALTVWALRMVPDLVLFRGPAWYRALMLAGEAAGAVFGILAFRKLDLWEFTGIRQAASMLRTGKAGGDREGLLLMRGVVSSGVYGIVRHPLYFAGIVIFTLQPVVTRNWLAVAVLADAYFIYGALAEQKRLLRLYGDEYREYMNRVPLLLPLFRAKRK